MSFENQVQEMRFDITSVDTVDEMNDLMFKVSTFLVKDRSLLSRWIAGIQQGFSSQFILITKLNRDAKELELLKEFFASRIETLKLRIEELLNEKEDYSEMHQSDSTIKEHLITKMNELDKQVMEKTTELLFQKKKASELEAFKKEFDVELNAEKNARKELEVKKAAEIKIYKQKNKHLKTQNKVLKAAISEMTRFFQTMDKRTGNSDGVEIREL